MANGKGFIRNFLPGLQSGANLVSRQMIRSSEQADEDEKDFQEYMRKDNLEREKTIGKATYLTRMLDQNYTPGIEDYVEGMTEHDLSYSQIKGSRDLMSKPKNTFKLDEYDTPKGKVLEQQEFTPEGELVGREIIETRATKLRNFERDRNGKKEAVTIWSDGTEMSWVKGTIKTKPEDLTLQEGIASQDINVNLDSYETLVRRLMDLHAEATVKDPYGTASQYRTVLPAEKAKTLQTEIINKINNNLITERLEKIPKIFNYSKARADEAIKGIVDRYSTGTDKLSNDELRVIGFYYRTIYGEIPRILYGDVGQQYAK